jgi:hypothetical protein
MARRSKATDGFMVFAEIYERCMHASSFAFDDDQEG